MELWRISNHLDLEGLGGERGSARWHSQGDNKRIVYLAEHPAVSLIETLVNLKTTRFSLPDHFQLLKIEAPLEISVETIEAKLLPPNWLGDVAATQQMGDEWLAAGKTALLRVPSAPSPESTNYLLNPKHPNAASVVVEWSRWIRYDRRLFRLSE